MPRGDGRGTARRDADPRDARTPTSPWPGPVRVPARDPRGAGESDRSASSRIRLTTTRPSARGRALRPTAWRRGARCPHAGRLSADRSAASSPLLAPWSGARASRRHLVNPLQANAGYLAARALAGGLGRLPRRRGAAPAARRFGSAAWRAGARRDVVRASDRGGVPGARGRLGRADGRAPATATSAARWSRSCACSGPGSPDSRTGRASTRPREGGSSGWRGGRAPWS